MEQKIEDPLDSLTPFLIPFAKKDSIIFCNYCGSKAYNLANDASDDDMYALYVVPLSLFVSIQVQHQRNFPEQIVQKRGSVDVTIREIGAFCGLLIDANPNVIETLFMENVLFENEFFKELKTKRDWFITQRFVVKYLSWAWSALKEEEKGKLNPKGVRQVFSNIKYQSHGLRIIWQVKQILKTGKLVVYLEDQSKIRDKVLAIKMGGYKGEEPELHEIAQKLRAKIRPLEEKAKQSSLPANFLSENVQWINEWILKLRLKYVQ